MGVSVTTTIAGATVVTISGIADGALVRRLVDTLGSLPRVGPVVLDLSDVTLSDPDAVRVLSTHIERYVGVTRARLVCARLSARRMLRRFGHRALRLYPSVESALPEPVLT
jgi:hypothetical protein